MPAPASIGEPWRPAIIGRTTYVVNGLSPTNTEKMITTTVSKDVRAAVHEKRRLSLRSSTSGTSFPMAPAVTFCMNSSTAFFLAP